VGVYKHIPVCQEAVDLFSTYGSYAYAGAVDEYYRNTRGHSFKSGHLMLGVEAKPMFCDDDTPKGPISATGLNRMRKLMPYIFSSPVDVIMPEEEMDLKYLKARYALACSDLMAMSAAFMTSLVDVLDYIRLNWEMLVEDIRMGTIDDSVELSDEMRAQLEAELVPKPERAYELGCRSMATMTPRRLASRRSRRTRSTRSSSPTCRASGATA